MNHKYATYGLMVFLIGLPLCCLGVAFFKGAELDKACTYSLLVVVGTFISSLLLVTFRVNEALKHIRSVVIRANEDLKHIESVITVLEKTINSQETLQEVPQNENGK